MYPTTLNSKFFILNPMPRTKKNPKPFTAMQ